MRRLISSIAVLSFAAVAAARDNAPAVSEGPFLQQVKTHFATWDGDKDGKLSFAEIELACTDPAVKGRTAVAAATMRNLSKLRDLTLPEYTAALTATDSDKPNTFETAFATAEKKLAGINRDVFASGMPKGSQLAQGKLGDCFLLVGVGTMAQLQPQRLKQMVDELPDGKTAVRFGNGQTVVLPLPTDAEVLIGAHTRGDGVWANVFEKAIGERYRLRQTSGRIATPFATIGGGGTPNVPLAMLTGNKVKREGCEMFQKPGLDAAGKEKRFEDIRVALESAFKDGRLVIGGTGGKGGGASMARGQFYNHSYGVLGYDRKTDLVSFWNPMSNGFKPIGEPGLENGYKTSYGQFDCPLKEAVMWFGSFSIEQSEKLDEIAEK